MGIIGGSKSILLGTAAAAALVASVGSALAGGLGVREQSTIFQGTAFAGSAAGGPLSSAFWNSAAMSTAGTGLQTESSYSLILPHVDVHADSISKAVNNTGALQYFSTGGDTSSPDRPAVVGASYASYRINDKLVLGLALNSPFGLSNEFDTDWSGQYFQRGGKLLTINANPMLSYQITPGVAVGVGVQAEYMRLKFTSNPTTGAAPPNQSSSVLEGDDFGYGFTAGILLQPAAGTSIGVGYRGPVHHKLEGQQYVDGGVLRINPLLGFGSSLVASPIPVEGEITTPDIVTLSLRQTITPTTRLLGTVEWTNWSRIDKVNFYATGVGGIPIGMSTVGQLISQFDFHWQDGWFFSVGGEYDYSSKLSLRSGLAYEISPIRNADQRKVGVSDSDRIWLSLGGSYKLTDATSFDLAYSHVFFSSAPIDSLTTAPGAPGRDVLRFLGSAEQSADILSAGFRTKW
jgi:long-chain fatty acid transport protein